MPESNAEKIRRLVTELARIRNQLRELVSEQAGDEAPWAGIVPETVAPSAVSAPSMVSPPSAAAARARADIEDFSPPRSDDPLEEILKASPPKAFKGAESEDDDVVVVDISLPSGKPVQSSRQGAAHESTAAQDTEPDATGSHEQPESHSGKPPAKDYPPKPPPRKRK